MSKYFFKGTDINNIINSSGSQVSNNFIGFNSSMPPYPIIQTPLELLYTDKSGTYTNNNPWPNTNTLDLSNKCTLNEETCTVSKTISVPVGAKYISGYCVGGGGGGGGEGGGGSDGFGKQNKGGGGGAGAPGNYSAIVQYKIGNSTNIGITVGNGGAGGAGGNESNNKGGNNGNPGTPGLPSSFIVGNTTICTANGGGGGSQGGSGNNSNSGGNGGDGNQTPGSVITSGVKNYTTTYNSPYPPFNTATGGKETKGGNTSNGVDGGDGGNGIVVIYFLYD
jgi:hypothetical protein